MTKKSPLSLFERLEQLRLSASILFDTGRVRGLKKEELQNSVAPLQVAFRDEIVLSAEADVAGCVLAVEAYEKIAAAHEQTADFLLEKAASSRGHAKSIRDALLKRMQHLGVECLQDGDFLVTRSLGADGKDTVMLR